MQQNFPKEFFQKTVSILASNFGEHESQALTYLILEKIAQISRTDIIVNQPFELNQDKETEYNQTITRLLSNEPIQYIFQEALFYGNTYFVNPHVLIPRQETELLIQIISNYKKWESPKIADIGTGSGCIACSLALTINNAAVTGYDISQDALLVAKRNSETLKANVQFSQLDILNEEIPQKGLDLIVSNPPYVMEKEMSQMKSNVLDHEPHLALFVEDDDPLIFYRAILKKAQTVLKKDGLVFFEINEQLGNETLLLFEQMGFQNSILYDDLNGKQRFASAVFI